MKDILSEIIANKRFEVDLQKLSSSCRKELVKCRLPVP